MGTQLRDLINSRMGPMGVDGIDEPDRPDAVIVYIAESGRKERRQIDD